MQMWKYMKFTQKSTNIGYLFRTYYNKEVSHQHMRWQQLKDIQGGGEDLYWKERDVIFGYG